MIDPPDFGYHGNGNFSPPFPSLSSSDPDSDSDPDCDSESDLDSDSESSNSSDQDAAPDNGNFDCTQFDKEKHKPTKAGGGKSAFSTLPTAIKTSAKLQRRAVLWGMIEIICKRAFACEGVVFGEIVRRLFFEPCLADHHHAGAGADRLPLLQGDALSKLVVDVTFPTPELAHQFIRHLQCDYRVQRQAQSPISTDLGVFKHRVSIPLVDCAPHSSPLVGGWWCHQPGIGILPSISVNVHKMNSVNAIDLVNEFAYPVPHGGPPQYFDIDMLIMTSYNSIEAPSHVCGEGRRGMPVLMHIAQRCASRRFCLVNGLTVANGKHFVRCYKKACELVKMGYTFDRLWAKNSDYLKRGGLPFRHAIVRKLGDTEDFKCAISLYDHLLDSGIKKSPGSPASEGDDKNSKNSKKGKNSKNSIYLVIELPCNHVFGADAFLQYVKKLVSSFEDPLSSSSSRPPDLRALKCPLCKRTLINDVVA